MRNSLFTILFTLFILPSFGQTGRIERITVRGDIRDAELNPVSYAHIMAKMESLGWVGGYDGKFQVSVLPGDTLRISAISFHPAVLAVPLSLKGQELSVVITMQKDTVNLKEVVVHPWPSTLGGMKREFMDIEIDDPVADLDLHIPSMKDIKAQLKTPGVPGQIGLYSGESPISMLYNKYSKEARSKRTYAELLKKDRAGVRYNKEVVKRITGLKNDDDIKKFMEFCSLQIGFILESTDYELYAAIKDCYAEFCLINSYYAVPGE